MTAAALLTPPELLQDFQDHSGHEWLNLRVRANIIARRARVHDVYNCHSCMAKNSTHFIRFVTGSQQQPTQSSGSGGLEERHDAVFSIVPPPRPVDVTDERRS